MPPTVSQEQRQEVKRQLIEQIEQGASVRSLCIVRPFTDSSSGYGPKERRLTETRGIVTPSRCVEP